MIGIMANKDEAVAMSGRAVSDKVFCPSQISALARFFSAGVFRELGKSASSPLLARLLADAGLTVPEVPNTKQYRAVGRVFQQLTPIQAHSGMVEVLQHTRSQKRIKTFIDELPDSLHAAALSTMLRPCDYRNVLASLDTSIEQAAAWA